MSELEKLVEKPKAKRVLKGVHFDFKGAEITYTDWSQGGACSLENEMVLAKAKDTKNKKELTPEQKAILDQIGEEYTELEKSKTVEPQSPSNEIEGEQIINEGTDEMSEDVLKELAALRRENAVIKAQKTVSSYGFDGELEEGLAGALADLEQDSKDFVVKALDALVANTEAKVEAAVTKAKETIETADTDLQKALDSEAGEGGEPEAEVEKSFTDQIAAYQGVK